jgi:surface carbohydrate biosynthesis protein
MKRILLLVEFKLRDLPSCVLLKYMLERRFGYQVRLGPPGSEREAVAEFRPHLVIYSHLRYPESVKRARELRCMGIGVAVLHTEGASILEGPKMVIAGKFSDHSVADIQFVWNQEMAALTKRFHPATADRVHVVGSPRMDFYFAPLNRLHMPKEEFCRRYGLAAERPVVTWASNFGWVRLADQPSAINEVQARYHREGVAQFAPWNNIADVVRRESVSRRLQADAFVDLARAFGDVGFVLKTHPIEDGDWYQSLCRAAGLKNVVIVTKEYIWDVLNASSFHLHRSCTTALEAWLMGKPTIDLMLNPEEWYYSEELSRGGDVVTSSKELIECVGTYLSGASVPAGQLANRDQVLRDWFDRRDGCSAGRHAAIIRDFLETGGTQEPSYRPGWADVCALAKMRVRRLLGLNDHDSLRFWHRETREKFFTDDEARVWMEKIESVLA